MLRPSNAISAELGPSAKREAATTSRLTKARSARKLILKCSTKQTSAPAKIRAPVFHSVAQTITGETFVAHHPHQKERTANRRGQEFRARAGKGGCIFSTENVGRDREIELIDQAQFEQAAE